MVAILIIEDDENVAELLKDEFEEEGYNSFIAHTGSEGLKSIDEKRPDCITLDIHLPDIDGLEILRKIKDEKRTLPVVVITSDDTVENKVGEYHPEGFFTKPIDFHILKNILKKIIKVK